MVNVTILIFTIKKTNKLSTNVIILFYNNNNKNYSIFHVQTLNQQAFILAENCLNSFTFVDNSRFIYNVAFPNAHYKPSIPAHAQMEFHDSLGNMQCIYLITLQPLRFDNYSYI